MSSSDATLDDVAVTDNNIGGGAYSGIEIDRSMSTPTAAILTLDGGTTITGGGTGTLAIGTTGTLDVEKGTSGPGATLDGVKVTDSDSTAYLAGTSNAGIEVGETSAAVLLVSDGTTITGGGTGTLAIGTTGTLDVEKGTSGPGATLDGVKVTDSDSTTYLAGTSNAGIEVGETSAAVLLVSDGTTITGGGTGTLAIGTTGTLDVEKGTSGPGATLDGVKVTDSDSTAYLAGTSNAGIEVGETSAAVLLVDDGTTITGGGTGTLAIGTTGTLDVEKGTSRALARRSMA